jgi:hypothetical protein
MIAAIATSIKDTAHDHRDAMPTTTAATTTGA